MPQLSDYRSASVGLTAEMSDCRSAKLFDCLPAHAPPLAGAERVASARRKLSRTTADASSPVNTFVFQIGRKGAAATPSGYPERAPTQLTMISWRETLSKHEHMFLLAATGSRGEHGARCPRQRSHPYTGSEKNYTSHLYFRNDDTDMPLPRTRAARRDPSF